MWDPQMTEQGDYRDEPGLQTCCYLYIAIDFDILTRVDRYVRGYRSPY